jgi:hypothetical protein
VYGYKLLSGSDDHTVKLQQNEAPVLEGYHPAGDARMGYLEIDCTADCGYRLQTAVCVFCVLLLVPGS